jgi:hypothetical protein
MDKVKETATIYPSSLQVQSSLTAQELESYGDAGAVVEEVLSSVRTVVAFGGENKEVAR